MRFLISIIKSYALNDTMATVLEIKSPYIQQMKIKTAPIVTCTIGAVFYVW